MTNRISLVALALLFLATSASAANRPNGYKTICTENKSCIVASPTRVAFGRAGQFFYKELTGGFACAASAFGGRIPGGVNECSVPIKPTPVITGASCVSTGVVEVSAIIEVAAGTTFDGGCKTYLATQAWANSQPGETMPPIFRLRDGATIKNVLVDDHFGTDSIHTYGNVVLDNVTWVTAYDNALTVRASGIVDVRNVSILEASYDPAFQINSASTLRVFNMLAKGTHPNTSFFRQNGGTTFKTDISCDSCDVGPTFAVFRTNSSISTARFSNSRMPATAQLCVGYASGKCTSSNVVTY